MFGISTIFVLALALSGAQAAPLHTKRIAQVISDSTRQWEAACIAAGGGQKCNPLSVTAFTTLLAAAGPCDQQNAADQMVDLAKQLNRDGQMIRLAEIFIQQPRNTPSSQSVPYCQQPTRNSELSGLFQCQFAGADPQTFVGGIALGMPGTMPFGASNPLSPLGACQANPSGPIPDGQQLVDITEDPGTLGDSVKIPPTSTSMSMPMSMPSGVPSMSMPSDMNMPAMSMPMSMPSSVPSMSMPASSPASMPTPSVSNSQPGSFQLQNGKDAQMLNAMFSTLTPNSSCTDGQDACVSGGFAQCVGGKFAITQCSSGLMCAALPLVNKPGTSIACTTLQDALTRIANTGAPGGLTGSG